MNKEIFLHAKDWIIANQKNDGAICWDEHGKFDAWDHSECLLALAIFEEWDHFDKGLEYVFSNINSEGLIISETIEDKVTKDYYEPHHAAYIFLPLVQKGSEVVDYKFWFKVENLKILPGTYDVSVSSKNISNFKNSNVNIEYFIALEPESKYG